MFYVIYPELWQFSVKMEILEFTSKEVAAPLMSVMALCGFGNFEKKIQILEIFANLENNGELWKILN